MSDSVPKPALVDYSRNRTPDDYRCTTCGVTGVKLWRLYMTSDPQPLCARCTAESQGVDISDLDGNGTLSDPITKRRTSDIGWYVLAVPAEDGVGYWGYLAIPSAGIVWWRRLPTFPPDTAE
jgi:hypothetical protein